MDPKANLLAAIPEMKPGHFFDPVTRWSGSRAEQMTNNHDPVNTSQFGADMRLFS